MDYGLIQIQLFVAHIQANIFAAIIFIPDIPTHGNYQVGRAEQK